MPPKRRPSGIAGSTEVVDVLAAAAPAEPAADDADLRVVSPDARPVPERELSPEQRRIRDLEHQLALEKGRKDPEPEYDTQPAAVSDGDAILIHFLEDGFTAFGQVWYRGQEVEVAAGSQQYRDTCDRFGRSWLELRNDEFAQADRWGKVMFRSGPWPGKKYSDATQFERLKGLTGDGSVAPTPDELHRAEQEEAKRGRRVPRLSLR
jgi:hypothetical protein